MRTRPTRRYTLASTRPASSRASSKSARSATFSRLLGCSRRTVHCARRPSTGCASGRANCSCGSRRATRAAPRARAATITARGFAVTKLAAAVHAGALDVVARDVRALPELLQSQIDADGLQAGELIRTRPMHYILFNLRGWFNVALYAQRVGVDLWHLTTPNCAGLRGALDEVFRYAVHTNETETPVLGEVDLCELVYLLDKAAAVYGDADADADTATRYREQSAQIDERFGCAVPAITLLHPNQVTTRLPDVITGLYNV
eukprot:TRINITY_DN902_c0_g1_i1.p1 TRINITY_DN902_c0_g1~~TRINITY_DN902_c0_g1_i1.p1  ORF type:complete len:261 (+),score=69.16 TRINITY_DN902_c0_g1_i1:40-822(+)